tara:strand:- start:647 stop:862 length:216 start_codon:yes stop_codon:yes gene_type:complete
MNLFNNVGWQIYILLYNYSMEPIYGFVLLFLGLLVTVGFFYFWFYIQTPKKKDEPENDVLKRSGFGGDDTV